MHAKWCQAGTTDSLAQFGGVITLRINDYEGGGRCDTLSHPIPCLAPSQAKHTGHGQLFISEQHTLNYSRWRAALKRHGGPGRRLMSQACRGRA